MKPVYLDYNASTPVAPAVRDFMIEALGGGFGNPSSAHWAGRPARERVDDARAQVAALLGCEAAELVFTSGGSEANNLALKGTFFASRRRQPHFISTRVEHPAVVAPLEFLQGLGATVTWLPVDAGGRIDPDDLRRAITADTVLISVMHANNEVGTLQPVAACAAVAREHGILFHTDAAQSVGKIDTRVDELGVDLLSVAGHKCYAPKGIGALYVRRGIELTPLIHGAGHEAGRRAGTESALLDGALGQACTLVADLSPMSRVQSLRDRLWAGLAERLGDRAVRLGDPDHCLPNTLNVALPGRVGAEVLAALPWLAASTGSACHADRVELSPVLAAMGVAPDVGMGAIRLSLGRETIPEEVDAVVDGIVQIVDPS